jgi:hypothetical protein
MSAGAKGEAAGRARAEAVAAARRLGPADRLVEGVLDLAGARALALDALLSVSAVEWSAEITTACVECADRPRLLLNPRFVEVHCTTRERLAMLLLHELSHISLGHTRLFPRITALHNVAFDAIINASLLHALAAKGIDPAGYAALLEACYGARAAPFFILRPPPGWPGRPGWSASGGCDPHLREIHRRLYAPVHRQAALQQPTYAEITSALRSAGAGEAGGALLARLLGSHGGTEAERSAESSGRDARAAELLGTVIAAVGVGDGLIGVGGERYLQQVARRRAERALENALAALLRRLFLEDAAGAPRWLRHTVPTVSTDPGRDRRAHVRRAAARRLGAPAPLLFTAATEHLRRERRAARIYLDVSGSMNGLLERLHAALVPLRRLLAAEIFVFSTEVHAVSRAEFLRGMLPTTGGTSVEPVLRHHAGPASLRSGRSARRALILTDGWFDAPPPSAVRLLREAGREIHLGVLGHGLLHDRDPWVASATRLPDSIHAPNGA